MELRDGKMKKGIYPRSRWEIVLDILRAISEEERESGFEAEKTRFMQMTYLDERNYQRYLDFLLIYGFVRASNGPEKGMSYELTEIGKELLKRLREVEDTLRQDFSSSPSFHF